MLTFFIEGLYSWDKRLLSFPDIQKCPIYRISLHATILPDNRKCMEIFRKDFHLRLTISRWHPSNRLHARHPGSESDVQYPSLCSPLLQSYHWCTHFPQLQSLRHTNKSQLTDSLHNLKIFRQLGFPKHESFLQSLKKRFHFWDANLL